MNTPVRPTPALENNPQSAAGTIPRLPLGDGRRTSPAVDHYGGVVVPVGPDGFDKLDESAARLWDAVFGPRCVVEVTHQDVVPVLQESR